MVKNAFLNFFFKNGKPLTRKNSHYDFWLFLVFFQIFKNRLVSILRRFRLATTRVRHVTACHIALLYTLPLTTLYCHRVPHVSIPLSAFELEHFDMRAYFVMFGGLEVDPVPQLDRTYCTVPPSAMTVRHSLTR